MLDYLRQMWEGIVQVWRRLTVSARVNIAITLFVTLALIAALVLIGGRREYVNLYSNLDPAEVQEIQSILSDAGISYEMAHNYTTIRVPDRQAGRARVLLREQDLPTIHGLSPGWELLDEETIWTSQQRHETNKHRAIQGELQRMLDQLDFVRRSFVHIHHAPTQLFEREQRPSEAAVTLNVTRSPSRAEIQTILGIVATFGGVNLDRSRITLATTDGDLLHSPAADEITRIASSKHELIKQLEQQREDRIVDAFERMGRRAIVRVSAQLDFSSREIESEEVTEGVDLSTAETLTQLTTRESLPEGPAGAMANLPEGMFGPMATETEEVTEEIVTNTEPSRTVSRTKTEPGDVLQYKVSAIIDWTRQPELDEEGQPTGEYTYGPPEEDELDGLRLFIANAVGPDVQPDDVHVIAQALDIDILRDVRETFGLLERAAMWSEWTRFVFDVLRILLVLGGFYLAYRWLMSIIVSEGEEEEEEVAAAPAPSKEELRKREIAQEVEKLSTEEPDAVASLLRSWMTEGEE